MLLNIIQIVMSVLGKFIYKVGKINLKASGNV